MGGGGGGDESQRGRRAGHDEEKKQGDLARPTINSVKLDPDDLLLVLRRAPAVGHDALEHGHNIAKHGLGPVGRGGGEATGEGQSESAAEETKAGDAEVRHAPEEDIGVKAKGRLPLLLCSAESAGGKEEKAGSLASALGCGCGARHASAQAAAESEEVAKPERDRERRQRRRTAGTKKDERKKKSEEGTDCNRLTWQRGTARPPVCL